MNCLLPSLVMIVSLSVFSLRAGDQGYSAISKKSIRNSTVIGATVGILESAFFAYLNGARDWNGFKRHSALLIAGTGLGALIGYGISAAMTPEWDFGVVKNDIKSINESKYLALLAQIPCDNFMNELKNLEAPEMLPIYAAFTIYSKYLQRIESCRAKLQTILKSEVTELHEPSYVLLQELDNLEVKIRYALLAVKNNENFLKEFDQAVYVKALNQQPVIYVYYY